MNDFEQAPRYAPRQLRKNSSLAGPAFTILASVMQASVAIARLRRTAAYGSRGVQSARRWLVSHTANPELQPYRAAKP